MIGHYLLTLCPAAEHDVLTSKMSPGSYGFQGVERCLVGTAANRTMVVVGHDAHFSWQRPQHFVDAWMRESGYYCVEETYDQLCKRFGPDRINGAIRNRILSNIARRTLAHDLVPA